MPYDPEAEPWPEEYRHLAANAQARPFTVLFWELTDTADFIQTFRKCYVVPREGDSVVFGNRWLKVLFVTHYFPESEDQPGQRYRGPVVAVIDLDIERRAKAAPSPSPDSD